MNDLLRKYRDSLRVLEIHIYLNKKYGIIETMASSSLVDSDDSISKEVQVVKEYEYLQSSELILQRLNKQILDNDLNLKELKIGLSGLLAMHNDNVGANSEEFWHIVEKEGLNFKRKNNRLLNILKKGYISIFEDKEIFYIGISALLTSKIFDQVYGKEVRNKVLSLIESSFAKTANVADRLLSQEVLSDTEKWKLWDIYSDLNRYCPVLKIPDTNYQRIQFYIDKNVQFYYKYGKPL